MSTHLPALSGIVWKKQTLEVFFHRFLPWILFRFWLV